MQSLLGQTANPEAPNEVNVSQPSDVLTARAAAAGAFDSLFLGRPSRAPPAALETPDGAYRRHIENDIRAGNTALP